jgi:hypothetical protein
VIRNCDIVPRQQLRLRPACPILPHLSVEPAAVGQA